MAFHTQLARQLRSPWKLRLWMLRRLPMGLISGMTIQRLDEAGCEVVLGDHWWIRNPFGSVFWAVMGMAAELSTGALVYAYAHETDIRFILVGMEARFYKKARGKSYYFCDHGHHVGEIFQEPLNPADTKIVVLPVKASNAAGEILAEFQFQWQLRKPSFSSTPL